MAKIKSFINKEDRAALYSVTVEAVAVETVMEKMKAATIASDMADAIIDAFKMESYRRFVEMMTNYGHLQTIDEINEWWSFVTAIMTGKADISTGHVTFEFDLQRFCETKVVQHELDDIKKAIENIRPDTVNKTIRYLQRKQNMLTRQENKKFSSAEIVKIRQVIETELRCLYKPFIEQLNEFATIEDICVVPDTILWHYMKAAEVLRKEGIRNEILAELEARKQQRTKRAEELARESEQILTATVDDFGTTAKEQLEGIQAKYYLVRGHARYTNMPNREAVINHLAELIGEARTKSRGEARRNILERLKNGQQNCNARGKKRIIRSLYEAEKRMKVVLKRNGKGMIVTKLHFAANGRALTSQHYQDYGYTVRKMEKLGQIEAGKLIDSYNVVRRVKRLCRAYIMVSVADMCALANFFETGEEHEIWHFRAIYRTVDPAGYDRFWAHVMDGDRHYMVDLCSNEGTSEENRSLEQNLYAFEDWEDIFAINGYYRYDGSWATSSPGELKNKVIMLPGSYVNTDLTAQEHHDVNWSQFFDEGTSGAWTQFCIRNVNELTFSDIAEFTARITLINAYAKYFYNTPMRSFAVYTGKFKAKKSSGLIPEGHQFMDGLFLYRSEYIAKMLEDALVATGEDVTVDPDAVIGMGLQSRPFNTKGFALVTTTSSIEDLMEYTGVKRINVYVPTMTAEQKKAWWNLSLNKFKSIKGLADEGGTSYISDGKVVDLAEKVLVFYYDKKAFETAETPDCLVDGNALKVGHELDKKRKPVTKVLTMAHKDKGENVTSTQMLYAYFASDYERTMKQLEVILDIKLQDIKKRLTNKQGEAPSVEDFVGRYDIYTDRNTGEEIKEWIPPRYGDIVDKIAPIIATSYSFGAWRKKVDKEVERLSKRIERLNLPIEGTHVTIVPDLGMTFGGGISVLGVNEDGVTELFSNNPLATTLTKEKYINKYKALAAAEGVSEKVQQNFVDIVNTLSPGIVAVPADEITARANEGWDFDGDSMYLFKMHRGYVEFIGEDGRTHYRWANDGETPDGYVTFGHGNRYPKTHPDGFMKIMQECWLKQPVCVWIA